MATFPTPSQIQAQYLQILKSIKPTLNINDPNSDFVIRGKALSGLASGLYGDQAKVNNDTYISTARPAALALHGADLGIPSQPATQAACPSVQIPCSSGHSVPVGMDLIYGPTGVLYTTTSAATSTGTSVTVSVQCQVAGQIGNIAYPDTLTVVTPPSGVGTTAALLVSMADGSDAETTDSYRQRLLNRVQNAPAGGNQTDYPNFAFAANPSVRSAFIRRFGRGLGTVDVYITTGTTDIDSAITNGVAVVRIPSGPVIASVQAYYDAHVPLTDCAVVYAPTEISVNVGLKVNLAAGLTLSSVPSDPVYNPLSLTVLQLIQREISRPLYKLSVGGRVLPGGTQGYVVASDIEESLDIWLSAVVNPNTGSSIGTIPILADRQILPLNGSSYNLPLLQNDLASPGTLTVTLGV